MNSKHMILLAATLVFLLSLAAPNLSINAQTITAKPQTLTMKPPELVLKADIRVSFIEALKCQCTDYLPRVDALFIDRYIKVLVYNSGPNATESKLEVEFYDLRLSQMRKITKNVPSLGPRSSTWITVVNTPVLIRKSTGIKATVKPTSAKVVDTDEANNTKTVNDCFAFLI